jgi:ABC-type multidrug transport system ATPase subunit
MDTNSFISVRDVTKKYRSRIALDRVSIEVRRGEVFGLIGPNGAGKSTFISMLATINLKRGSHSSFTWTKAPIKDGFDGAGV